jgi:hypothetical protein
LSAANAHDNQFASKKPKRYVFMHSIGDLDDDIHYDDTSYDIDAPVSTFLANCTERRNKFFGSNFKNCLCMQRDKWFNLDTKSKEIWDQLDDKVKSIILGYDTRGYISSFTPSDGFSKTNLLPQQRINLHVMSAYDLLPVYALQVNHATSKMEELDDADDNTTETPSNTPLDDADTRLIHVATSSGNSILSPCDMCCVISKASKRFVNKCEYLVSKHDHNSNMSLVDRGANCGVAGNDVSVLFKTFRNMDIKGIDSFQLTNVPIGTVGGVVST